MNSQRELARQYGVNVSTLRSRLKKGWALEEALTTPKHKGKRKKRDSFSKLIVYSDDVLRLRKQGLNNKRIAEELGINYYSVKSIVAKYLKDKEIERPCAHNKNDEKNVRNVLKQYGYTYIGGYIDCESKITMRCDKCGCVFDYVYHNALTMLKGNGKSKDLLLCPDCRAWSDGTAISKLTKQKKIVEGRIKKENVLFQRATKNITRKCVVLTKYECVNCGDTFSLYTSPNSNYKFCSSKCRKKYYNYKKDKKREERLNSRPRDKDITLTKLYKRDNGVCYLCGGKCNFNDYKLINGVFYQGKTYPNVEHVIPVAKDGTDTWDNVRLAHSICNTHKGTMLIPSAMVG